MRSPDQLARRRSAAAARASAIPVCIGLVAVAGSLALAVLVIAQMSAPVRVFFDVPLPLVIADAWEVSLLGYLLTPVVAIVCYGWDGIAQRSGVRADANFERRPGFSTILRWTVAASVLVGVWHILNLSVPLTETWGLS